MSLPIPLLDRLTAADELPDVDYPRLAIDLAGHEGSHPGTLAPLMSASSHLGENQLSTLVAAILLPESRSLFTPDVVQAATLAMTRLVGRIVDRAFSDHPVNYLVLSALLRDFERFHPGGLEAALGSDSELSELTQGNLCIAFLHPVIAHHFPDRVRDAAHATLAHLTAVDTA